VINFLSEIPIFSGLGRINIGKYSSYFIQRVYKYNDIIYDRKNNRNEIYFILDG
jgi:hypothetical protein